MSASNKPYSTSHFQPKPTLLERIAEALENMSHKLSCHLMIFGKTVDLGSSGVVAVACTCGAVERRVEAFGERVWEAAGANGPQEAMRRALGSFPIPDPITPDLLGTIPLVCWRCFERFEATLLRPDGRRRKMVECFKCGGWNDSELGTKRAAQKHGE